MHGISPCASRHAWQGRERETNRPEQVRQTLTRVCDDPLTTLAGQRMSNDKLSSMEVHPSFPVSAVSSSVYAAIESRFKEIIERDAEISLSSSVSSSVSPFGCTFLADLIDAEKGLPPGSNTGGKSPSAMESSPTSAGCSVFVDTLTFTVSGVRFGYDVGAFRKWVERWSNEKLTIRGRSEKRFNGYPECWELGTFDRSESPFLGWVGVSTVTDNMRGRWCVHLTGAACEYLSFCEFNKLGLELLEYAGKITRVDLAYDDLDGKMSVEQVKEAYERGLFSMGGRNPQSSYIQNSHDKGDTFYVGSRTSGKLHRSYQKGKQLGCSVDKWVRHEEELKAISRVLPIEILFDPVKYFKGCYPEFYAHIPGLYVIIETKGRKLRNSIQKLINHSKQQAGRVIAYLSDKMHLSDSDIVNCLRAGVGKYPLRLFAIDWDEVLSYFWDRESSGVIDEEFWGDSIRQLGLEY